MTHDKIERLVFVKYLFNQVEKQKDLERPLSSLAILTLHDSVECFLQLLFEETTGKSKATSQNILDTYSEEINKVLVEKQSILINKAFIKRLNELRNQLKHSTIFVDQKNIQNLYSETQLFFVDFCEAIFQQNFHQISLITLIADTEVKRHLTSAEGFVNEMHFQNALFEVGKAFYLIESKVNFIPGRYGENLFQKHHRISYTVKYSAGCFGEEPSSDQLENLDRIADDINRLQDELFDLKKINSLSGNLKDYLKYSSIIPYVTKVSNGKETRFFVHDEENNIQKNYALEDVQFCLNFVTNLALSNNG